MNTMLCALHRHASTVQAASEQNTPSVCHWIIIIQPFAGEFAAAAAVLAGRAHAADPPASYIEADPDISKVLVGAFNCSFLT
jgi:hypothetical protein